MDFGWRPSEKLQITDGAPNNAHMAMHLQPSSTTLAAAGAMPDQDFLLVLDMLHAPFPG